MHRYVSVGDQSLGLTVFARGSFEYELTPDGAIAVTLLRAVGDFSRGNLTARPGHAAWPAVTPEAQEPGPFRVELGVVPYGADEAGSPAQWDRVERLAEEFHAPLTGLMLRYGIDLPATVDGPALSGPGLAFKALKPSETGAGVVIRCVNLTAGPAEGRWTWPVPVKRAALARLDETPLRDLPLEEGGRVIRFSAAARAVVTIVVQEE
jgi:alpha-mannosidase